MNHLLLILLLALFFSALFSGLEIAFVSSDRLRFEMDAENNTFSSRILARFYHNPNLYISTMLVGNNIALVVYSTMMARLIEGVVPDGLIGNEFLMVVIETLVSTAIVLVIGEFLPKTIFRVNPNGKLNILAAPLFLIYILLYPISLFTTWLARIILRLFGIRIDREKSSRVFSKIDLDYFVQSGLGNAEQENRDPEVRIFQNVLDFSNVKTRDCMIPRNEICAVSIDVSLSELRDAFIETGYSKILVYRGDMDHIIGYIHSSELFRHKENWQEHVQSVPFVPETLMAQKLMKQLMARKKSIAVVVDEFGGTSGMVSLEDIIEEILGEIEDEHDVNQLVAKKTDDGYLLSGRMEIDRVNAMFGLDIPESDEYMTVGGLILSKAKGFPKVNETVTADGYCFRILKRGDTKIELVELTIIK
ncbi:MAG: HlyC/CorC family transporter [Bacteroidaceae bacterium]|nr:HlyC/CorC family transporter [Bacteroidaceae bacterium]MBP5646532.1 HlyC/CorC family transporter [Bacteroidaceae bacterium]